MSNPALAAEVGRRRTFAIISHPDAGKTTLTEKLLLYGGAIDMAGSVRARRNQRHATSDWMAMEQQRGISITSTVLQFVYRDCQINLLDTPGHQDFSEDTYRTLAAADNAAMLIDAAKGIEAQTRKLFDVCRMRGIPIFTFINKLDRPGREPLELLDEIEKVLGIDVYPVNWPIGMGDTFRGVFDRLEHTVHLFDRTTGGKKMAPVTVGAIGDARMRALMDEGTYAQIVEEIELLDAAGVPFDLDRVAAGQLTPVFFGSAANNFGVQLFLDAFIRFASRPGTRPANTGVVSPVAEDFSGFVFKIQANMDPQHRDRVAFIRVCSGKFEKDMTVHHTRSGKKVRLSRSLKLFGQERETVEEAYAGDIVGVINPGTFAIGDTICLGKPLAFEGIPLFPPEHFATLRNPNPSKYKQFLKGVIQLREEGAVQLLFHQDEAKRDPILAAVGQLQFDVVRFRLESEYNVETLLEPLPWTLARWITAKQPEDLETIDWYFDSLGLKDHEGRLVILFKTPWGFQQMSERNPHLQFHKIAQF
ncbi:MAG: peptide chain release factor 3 [Aphanocapsa lilacina HA4352-LM1]|jgi:peptide chain release factor 3|nr:peptide chain release factor 3 [Aphanocapsa lilacina HA4352-LM1]